MLNRTFYCYSQNPEVDLFVLNPPNVPDYTLMKMIWYCFRPTISFYDNIALNSFFINKSNPNCNVPNIKMKKSINKDLLVDNSGESRGQFQIKLLDQTYDCYSFPTRQ